MSHRIEGGLLYVCHKDAKVRSEDWAEMIRDLEGYLTTNQYLPVFVKTDNAGPDAAQRSRVHEVVAARRATLKVAVMSSSVLVRGIVTALSWTKIINIRSFGPFDYAEALAFLEMHRIQPQAAAGVFSTLLRDVI